MISPDSYQKAHLIKFEWHKCNMARALESVRDHPAGLDSFLSTSRIDAN